MLTTPIQCDQIGRFIGLWAIFLQPLATINLRKSPTFLGNFSKVVKIFNFSSEIIFGNSYRHSQAQHLRFYHYSQFVLYLSCEKNENRHKEAGFGAFKLFWLIKQLDLVTGLGNANRPTSNLT